MNKKTASSQYASNQFGMSNGDPGKREARQGRRDARQSTRGGGGKDQEVSMNCSKDGCATFNTGGGKSNVGRETNRQNKGGAKGLSGRPQLARGRVLNERQANKARKESEKIRASAPARPMTRMEKEKASEMGPPAPAKEKTVKQPAVTAASRKAAERKANAPAPKPVVKKGLGNIFKRRQVQKITI